MLVEPGADEVTVDGARVEEIRGVNSDGVLANLELRDLVAEVGRGAGPGQPKLYATTMRFLQMLGLESLDQLPTPAADGTRALEVVRPAAASSQVGEGEGEGEESRDREAEPSRSD